MGEEGRGWGGQVWQAVHRVWGANRGTGRPGLGSTSGDQAGRAGGHIRRPGGQGWGYQHETQLPEPEVFCVSTLYTAGALPAFQGRQDYVIKQVAFFNMTSHSCRPNTVAFDYVYAHFVFLVLMLI